jgi:predicted DNA-binding protein
MPSKVSGFVIPIGLRVSRAQADKLDLLAARTGRPRNALLRYLIDQARLSGIPDIQLVEPHGQEPPRDVVGAKHG